MILTLKEFIEFVKSKGATENDYIIVQTEDDDSIEYFPIDIEINNNTICIKIVKYDEDDK